MHNINNLRIYQKARENLRSIHQLCSKAQHFGDLRNQLERSAISVVSNIAEGTAQDSNKQCLRFLGYARASNTELQSQIALLSDIGKLNTEHPLHDQIGHLGAMLSAFMAQLR